MILSDSKIRERLEKGELVVESLIWKDVFEQIWPASLDFRLGKTFKIYKKSRQTVIDSKLWVEAKHIETITLEEWEKFVLHPGDFVLWVTAEKIKIPYDLVARCEGRSSIWMLGVIIHSTAWFIDPGFEWTRNDKYKWTSYCSLCLNENLTICFWKSWLSGKKSLW